jgi:uncharacterized repeat protein (TIGR01451 family)
MTHLPRWQGATVGAILLTVLGVVVGLETVLLVGLVAVCLVLVAELSPGPPAEYTVRRSLDTDRPTPGEPVTVTVEISNESDRTLPDLRVSEDLPDDVAVVSGTPSVATALRAGETASHSYEIVAPRGEFSFGEPTVRRRNLAATLGAADHATVEGATEFTCETLLDRIPLRQQTIQYVGETATDTGGDGLEFFSVREYRAGDPPNRIDWNQYARSGTLSTVEYRVEQAVTVVFVVDDRVAGHVDCGSGPNSFDLSLYAAARGITAAIERGNRTGIATLTGGWVDPGTGESTRRRIESVLDTAATTDRAVATDGGTDRLLARLPANAQVVVCSPLVDDGVADAVERLAAAGHAVSVLSPDMTTGLGVDELTAGQRVAGCQRRGRIERLRGRGVAVADWTLREPVMLELQRLQRRWSP